MFERLEKRDTMSEVEERFDPQAGRARGVLRRDIPAGKMYHSRRSPLAALSHLIAHYWFIEWDLRGCEPQLVENTPHPNIHLVFDAGHAQALGVQTAKFSRVLTDCARVFGVKFRAGGFRPFVDCPLSKLMDRGIPATDVFGEDAHALAAIVFAAATEDELVNAANEFFGARIPKPDYTVEEAAGLVEKILNDTEIKTVDDLAARSKSNKRRLQRLFNDYVGASPKWVIRRYRLHELIEKIHSGAKLDWARIAVELGYFDQAHLINDFKSIVGYSPTDYEKQAPKIV
jgi:AraC-like DNA-binding protein